MLHVSHARSFNPKPVLGCPVMELVLRTPIVESGPFLEPADRQALQPSMQASRHIATSEATSARH